MLIGELRSQIDAIWSAFWSGGISNPLEAGRLGCSRTRRFKRSWMC